MTTTQIPSRDALKRQAKTLRADLRANGTEITHARALEMVAHQWGARDWNTLSAQATADRAPQWHPGQHVSGRYLGQAFRGVIKAARANAGGFWEVTVRFDAPVDVVTSAAFSNLRQQVTATVNARGRSPQKTSQGVPHLQLDL